MIKTLKNTFSFDSWACVSTIETSSKHIMLKYYHRLTGKTDFLTIPLKYYKKVFLCNTVNLYAVNNNLDKIVNNFDKFFNKKSLLYVKKLLTI